VSATIELPVSCSGNRHRLIVRFEARGRVHVTPEDHDPEVEAVLQALGGKPPNCYRVCRSVESLAVLVSDQRDLADWINLGVRNGDQLKAWRSAGVRKPRVAARWLSVTRQELVGEWRRWGFKTPEKAAGWCAAGFAPEEASYWKQLTSLDEASAWVGAGVSALDAAGWHTLGVRAPEQTREWVEVGVRSGVQAQRWASVGVRSQADVRRWLRGGTLHADDASSWHRAGARAADISWWQDLGVSSGRELLVWRQLGVERPQDLVLWQQAGVGNGILARRWLSAGVVSLEELAAWRSVGVDDPADTRGLGSSEDPPGGACRSALEGRPKLAQPGSSSARIEVRPPRPGAPLGTVSTERYYYTFGRFSGPELATDVIEVDVDADGSEIGRRNLPILAGRLAAIRNPLHEEELHHDQ
jgi:hypothetical protein